MPTQHMFTKKRIIIETENLERMIKKIFNSESHPEERDSMGHPFVHELI